MYPYTQNMWNMWVFLLLCIHLYIYILYIYIHTCFHVFECNLFHVSCVFICLRGGKYHVLIIQMTMNCLVDRTWNTLLGTNISPFWRQDTSTLMTILDDLLWFSKIQKPSWELTYPLWDTLRFRATWCFFLWEFFGGEKAPENDNPHYWHIPSQLTFWRCGSLFPKGARCAPEPIVINGVISPL